MTRHYRYPLSPAPDEHVHLPLGPRLTKPVATTSHASLAALQWAADRAGMSYGRFIQRLRPADEARIQEEFDAFITQRDADAAAKRAVREARETGQERDTAARESGQRRVDRHSDEDNAQPVLFPNDGW